MAVMISPLWTLEMRIFPSNTHGMIALYLFIRSQCFVSMEDMKKEL